MKAVLHSFQGAQKTVRGGVLRTINGVRCYCLDIIRARAELQPQDYWRVAETKQGTFPFRLDRKPGAAERFEP